MLDPLGLLNPMRRNHSPLDHEARLTATLYWIRAPEPLRLALLAQPRGGERLDNHIRGWRSHGVSTVISLLGAEEGALHGLHDEARLCELHGIEYVSLPMRRGGAPASYAETLAHARLVVDRGREGYAVALHGAADHGRAALVAACAMIAAGTDSQEALDLIAATRAHAAPESAAQSDWIADFEDRFRRSHPVRRTDDCEPVRLYG